MTFREASSRIYRSPLSASALLLYACLIAAEFLLANGPPSTGVLVVLALPLPDSRVFLLMRLTALTAGRRWEPSPPAGHLPLITFIMPSQNNRSTSRR